ncbi:MAG: UxaA family hydrolase [Caldilineaceae bacterium]|nr:UxaA family hydrolase [Caldilineaceae bacterium]
MTTKGGRPDSSNPEFEGFLRQDGRKGIRNTVLVAYLVECAHHVAREIVHPFRRRGVHLIGFSGCYPNQYAFDMMTRLCSHPNVGGVLLVSLGCESLDRYGLARRVEESGRPVETLVIQEQVGTLSTIERGQEWLESTLAELQATTSRTSMSVDELIVGAICGGSDATSGITANPAIGRCFDLLVEHNASAIFEEAGELIGCEQIMADRAVTPELAGEILSTMEKTARYYATLGHGSFAVGNADGGLTTVEEKSMGAYAKSGSSTIHGLIKPGDVPPAGGLYLMDVVPDGEVRFGFPNINDTVEIAELIASGAQMTLFSTGRGSVVGSAISPVIKVCANPETFRRMEGDMDVDAGRILEGRATLDEVGHEIFAQVLDVAAGSPTKSERLGHQEFVLTYKTFEPIGPACLPL